MRNEPIRRERSGRPNLYEEVIQHKIPAICKWIRNGYSVDEVCKKLGCAYISWHTWKAKYPEFKEAVENANKARTRSVEAAAIKSALGHTVEDTVVEELFDANGNLINVRKKKTKRAVEPKTAIQQFLLKSHDPDMYNKPDKIEHAGKIEFHKLHNDI